MSEGATSLSASAVRLISQRIADEKSLQLPGNMTGPRKTDKQLENDLKPQRVEYLEALLQRDPGVFLERHGDLLSAAELREFEPLRSDYEVDFYVKQLTTTGEPRRETPSVEVRNRRLAKLNRLINEDSFFSDESMRARQPLLHWQYVGQYRPAAQAPAPQAQPHVLSDSIIRSLEEEATLQRFQQQKEAQDAVEADTSDEEEYPEDRRAEVHQPGERTADAAEQDAAASTDTTTIAAPQPAEPAAAALTDKTAAAAEAEDAADGATLVPSPAEDNFVHIPEDEQRQLQQDFLELMHQRFLAGEDENFVDYKQIDNCIELDDDWAVERRQDIEEAYFDDM